MFSTPFGIKESKRDGYEPRIEVMEVTMKDAETHLDVRKHLVRGISTHAR